MLIKIRNVTIDMMDEIGTSIKICFLSTNGRLKNKNKKKRVIITQNKSEIRF